MADKVKIVLAGCGAIGRVQALALKELPNAQLCALYNRHLDKALALREELGLEIPVFDDYEKLISSGLCEAVSICTAPDQHRDFTCRALEHGLHVIVEKPMAKSAAECQAMIDCAHQHGRLLSVICQNRFRLENQRLKKLYEADLIGRPAEGTLESLWWRDQSYYDPAWRGTWQIEGGGCLMSHAVHQIDLMLWILGLPQAVSAQMFNEHHLNSECEDEVYALFYYEGFRVRFHCTLNHPGEFQGLSLSGQYGTLSTSGTPIILKGLPNGYPKLDEEETKRLTAAMAAIPPLEREQHAAQLHNFLNAVLGIEPLLTPGEQGRDALQTVLAIYKSAVTGQKVSLPLDPDDDFCNHERRVPLMPHFHEKTRSLETTASMVITLGSHSLLNFS